MNRQSALIFTTKALWSGIGDESVTAELKSLISRNRVSWERIAEVSSSQLVTTALWPALERRGLAYLLPEEFRVYLQTVHTLNSRRNLRIQKEAVHIIQLLNEAGIHPVALKGFAHLVTGLYSTPGIRVIGDLDLLIPHGTLKPAVQVLSRHGYDECSPSIDIVQAQPGPSWRSGVHYPRLVNQRRVAAIELHFRMSSCDLGGLLETQAVIERSVPISLDGAHFSVPGKLDQITHNVVHSEIGHRYHRLAALSLRNLYDFSLLTRETTDEQREELNLAFEKNGLTLILNRYSKNAARLFGSPLFSNGHLTNSDILDRIRFSLRWQVPLFAEIDARALNLSYSVSQLWTRIQRGTLRKRDLPSFILSRAQSRQWWAAWLKGLRAGAKG